MVLKNETKTDAAVHDVDKNGSVLREDVGTMKKALTNDMAKHKRASPVNLLALWIHARQSITRAYVATALMVTNTLVFFVALNLLLAISYAIKDSGGSADRRGSQSVPSDPAKLFNQDGSPTDNGRRSGYQRYWYDFNANENIAPGYAADVLDDFYKLSKLGFLYQPWVHFSEPPYKGRRVEVVLDPRGYPIRRTVNPLNTQGLPIVRIFAMGGSTTFGYNVSDEQTWPSYLSRILNEKAKDNGLHIHVEVTNYGRGFYYPSQEAVLIAHLLKNDHPPNLVIFMDGLNWGALQDTPAFYERFERQFKNMQFETEPSTDTPILEKLKWIPIVRLANSVRHRVFGAHTISEQKRVNSNNPRTTDSVVNMFRQNREISAAICNLYSLKALFFIQPNAIYNYPAQLYRSPLPEEFWRGRHETAPFYERMRHESGSIYLGDLFESWGYDRKAIIDEVHYSPGFNEFLAKHVAKYIDLGSLTPSPQLIDESAATGARRR